MPTVSYTTLNGVNVSEDRAGVKRDYISDSLGSTIALVDDTQTITDTFFYWPFGEIRTQTGTTKTPFTFVGTLGYYMDIASSLYYVRMRHLRSLVARWLTVDPVWPGQPAYAYAGNSPVNHGDALGLQSGGELPIRVTKFCNSVCAKGRDLCKDEQGQQAAGCTLCCDLVMCACNFQSPALPFPGLINCTWRHELTHFGQLTCPPGCPVVPNWTIQQDQGECVAYGREVRCYQENENTDCGPLKGAYKRFCLDYYKTAICGACAQMKAIRNCALPRICNSC